MSQLCATVNVPLLASSLSDEFSYCFVLGWVWIMVCARFICPFLRLSQSVFIKASWLRKEQEQRIKRLENSPCFPAVDSQNRNVDLQKGNEPEILSSGMLDHPSLLRHMGSSSLNRDQTWASALEAPSLSHWATREAYRGPSFSLVSVLRLM